MTTSVFEIRWARIRHVVVTEAGLIVDLDDERTISVPLAWYPRLLHARQEERDNWRLIGKGTGVYRPDLDEDISVDNILAGSASGESQGFLSRWLKERAERGV